MSRVLVCVWLLAGLAAAQTEQRERKLGQELSKEVLRRATTVDDAVIDGHLDRIVRMLSRHCPAEVPIELRVIVSGEVNAFALPGGFLFVHTAMLRDAASEAELAGVLAHLIERVRAGGSLVRVNNRASIPLIFMGGWYGYSYRPGTSVLVPLGFAKAHRAAVLEADRGAARCLFEAGYDPQALAENLRRLGPSPDHSTHPPPEKRIQNVQAVIAGLPSKQEYVVSTEGFEEMRRSVPVPVQRVAEPPSLRR